MKLMKNNLKKMIDSSYKVKGPFKGYKISNTYRAKNGFGALGLETTKFEIDSSLTKVLNATVIK